MIIHYSYYCCCRGGGRNDSIGMLELYRRFQWGLFRVELEHLNNSEGFRTIKVCICTLLFNGQKKRVKSIVYLITSALSDIRGNTTIYNTIQYNTLQYSTIQYNTIQYNTIQYNTIQYNTIQYNTIQYTTI